MQDRPHACSINRVWSPGLPIWRITCSGLHEGRLCTFRKDASSRADADAWAANHSLTARSGKDMMQA